MKYLLYQQAIKMGYPNQTLFTNQEHSLHQLTRIIIINRNSKEHRQNKVNQKQLPQLKKYFRSFI